MNRGSFPAACASQRRMNGSTEAGTVAGTPSRLWSWLGLVIVAIGLGTAGCRTPAVCPADCRYCPPPPLGYGDYPTCVCHSDAVAHAVMSPSAPPAE